MTYETRAGSIVDGLNVSEVIPNRGSVASTLTNYEILDGIRVVPVADFDANPKDLFYAADDIARVKKLAAQIQQSNYISPLIIVVDAEGPYVLEGAHRLGALYLLGKTEFPAMVVIDKDDAKTSVKTAKAKTLYHGTSVARAESIKKHGIWPSVGEFVSQLYAQEPDLLDADLEPLVFMADKESMQVCMNAMAAAIGAELGKSLRDVTELEIRNHGALCVLREGAEYLPQATEDLVNSMEEIPPQVEPGDYYSDSTVHVDYILTGAAMMRFLKRFGCSWGEGLAEKRQQLMKMMMTEPKGSLGLTQDHKDILNFVNSLDQKTLSAEIRKRQKQGSAKTSYLVENVSALKRYLEMSDADKGRDLAINYPDVFQEWAKDHGLDGPIDDTEEYAAELPDDLAREFYEHAYYKVTNYGADAPSYLYMEYRGLIKDQWLIHFTDEAYTIAREGFLRGVDDLARLGLTTAYDNDSILKAGGGYNFAFRLQDFMRFGRDRGRWKYGPECVVFRASGVLVWHHGDEEYQVIFEGKTAHDIVPLVEGNDGWEVVDWRQHNAPLFVNDELYRVVDWVVNNFDQYRRQLVKTPGKQLVPSKTAKPAPALQALAQEFMAVLDPDGVMSIPTVNVVTRQNADWGGLCTSFFRKKDGYVVRVDSRIDIQSWNVNNNVNARRVIAHECCHHSNWWRHLVNVEPEVAGQWFQATKGDNHGADWEAEAERLNSVYGANFVTKTSDQSYEKNELPPVYIFLVKYSDGRLGIARAVKPSQAQIEFMQEHLQQNPGSFKVVRVPDSDFILGAPAIGDDKYNVALSDEGKAMIQGFWDNGNDVSQQILQKQFGFGTFYVVMQRHGRTGQLLAWALKPMTPSAKKSLERRSVYNEIRLMKSKDQELFESLAEYSASTAAAGTTVAEVPELEQMWNEAKPFDTAKTAASFATEGVPDRKHEFGCVMLLPPQDIAEAVLELGKKLVHDDEVYEDPEDSSFGREMTPHTTALWGIKPEKVRDRIKKVLEQVTPREFRLMNVTFFDDNDDYDVVKFDLTGDDLYAFHDALLEEFPDTKQTFDFRPHMTISYVLKGKGAEICERAKEWEGLTVPVRAVDYSRQDGVHEYINIEDSKEKQANPKQRGADEWFKGSRVADAAGNPFTVYHGTTSKISAEPNKFVRGRIYYHGTSEEKAQQILRDGFIEPWDIVGKSNYSGSLTPVANRSYVTPDLDQAIRYAAPAPADYIAGARGYIFEIDGAALSDVIPDEDAILNILEDIQRGSNVTGIQSRHRLKKRIVDWLAQKYEAGTLKDGEHMNLDEAKVIAQQLPQDITLDILKMPVVGIANEGHIPFLDCYSFNYDALVRLGRLRAAGKPTNLKNWADLVAIGV